MPELPELRLMATYINSKCASKIVVNVKKHSISKQPDLGKLLPSEFTLYAHTRGKELQLTIFNIAENAPIKVTFTMGMSGNFLFKKEEENQSKWAMLVFLFDNGDFLEMTDTRRFAKWSVRDWNIKRSPDLINNHNAFINVLHRAITTNKSMKKIALCDLLLNQSYFNGLGNYLRAEILGRLNINPFQPITALSDQDFARLVKLCKECSETAYELGGGQLMTWKDPNGTDPAAFRKWLSFYGNKKECIRVSTNGRIFWCSAKWVNEANKYCAKTI